jgi:GNAT superfamily N-acetyltransferase
MKIVPITNAVFDVIEHEWLIRAETVHRQLRPSLPVEYARRMKEIFAIGTEMAVAVVGEKVVGVAVFRMLDRNSNWLEIYCDDLVADEAQRSKGIGSALINYMHILGRERGCNLFSLDSRASNQQAHKFYFREGFLIHAFHFTKALNK